MKSIEFIDEILSEWASKIENGKPDVTDCFHVSLLSQVLREMKFSNDFIGEFIGNLNLEQGNTCSNTLNEETGSYDYREMGGPAFTGAFAPPAVGGEGISSDDNDDVEADSAVSSCIKLSDEDAEAEAEAESAKESKDDTKNERLTDECSCDDTEE